MSSEVIPVVRQSGFLLACNRASPFLDGQSDTARNIGVASASPALTRIQREKLLRRARDCSVSGTPRFDPVYEAIHREMVSKQSTSFVATSVNLERGVFRIGQAALIKELTGQDGFAQIASSVTKGHNPLETSDQITDAVSDHAIRSGEDAVFLAEWLAPEGSNYRAQQEIKMSAARSSGFWVSDSFSARLAHEELMDCRLNMLPMLHDPNTQLSVFRATDERLLQGQKDNLDQQKWFEMAWQTFQRLPPEEKLQRLVRQLTSSTFQKASEWVSRLTELGAWSESVIGEFVDGVADRLGPVEGVTFEGSAQGDFSIFVKFLKAEGNRRADVLAESAQPVSEPDPSSPKRFDPFDGG